MMTTPQIDRLKATIAELKALIAVLEAKVAEAQKAALHEITKCCTGMYLRAAIDAVEALVPKTISGAKLKKLKGQLEKLEAQLAADITSKVGPVLPKSCAASASTGWPASITTELDALLAHAKSDLIAVGLTGQSEPPLEAAVLAPPSQIALEALGDYCWDYQMLQTSTEELEEAKAVLAWDQA